MATLDQRVQADEDNCKAKSGSYDRNNPLRFGREGKNAENDVREYGRWKPQIPVGSTINSAYLYRHPYSSRSDAFYSGIRAIQGSCPPFTSNPWTLAFIGSEIRYPASGNLPADTACTESDPTPDLKSLIDAWITDLGGAYDPATSYIGLVIMDGDAANNEYREDYAYAEDPTKTLRLVIDYTPPAPTETITAQSFPMTYLEKPVKAKQLTSKSEGATVTHIAKDFPEVLLKNGKAKELRSKWS